MNVESIMLGTVAILVGIVSFFLVKFFSRTDKWEDILVNLDKMVSLISIRLESVQNDTRTHAKRISHHAGQIRKLEKELSELRASVQFCQTQNPSCVLHDKGDSQ